MKKTQRKLAFEKHTIANLSASNLRDVAGGARPLTFYPCDTANCQTLGTACPTHDCTLTFGTACFTHDCTLTFTSC
jgi:hypothetical protein